ncbi:MAG: tRNA dihydrouridine(20/20a) synthase DusA [Pseudomonadota bacterium]
MNSGSPILPHISVAPMMAWTDRHCRFLLRETGSQITLFTEMITAGALLHGPRERLLAYDAREHPVVIQLGGSEPADLAQAAVFAAEAGFDEINLNVGCPSPRVQRGAFGACLMREPELVGELVAAMREAVHLPVTVKCRLGVDDADSQPLLEQFIATVADAGCKRFYLHARKALLNGLSPAQNRQIPPLQYERVYALKTRFPELQIMINGGVDSADAVADHLSHTDGVMIGRAAYHNPLIMNELAVRFHGERPRSAFDLMAGYRDYMIRELDAGTRLADMTRHCLGLFSGMPGARRYRRLLSDHKALARNDIAVVDQAIGEVMERAA